MKKKKKIRKKQNKNGQPALLGIALILFGLISFISLYSSKMGLFGIFIYKVFTLLSGSGNFIIPCILVISGILLLLPTYRDDILKYSILFSLICLCILVYLDGTKNIDLTLVDRIAMSVEYLDIATSGGVIGSIFGFFMYKFFGSIGTYMILATIILVCVFLILKINLDTVKNFGTSFSSLGNSIGTSFSHFKENMLDKLEEKKLQREFKKQEVETANLYNRDSSNMANVVIRGIENDEEEIQEDYEDENIEEIFEDTVSNLDEDVANEGIEEETQFEIDLSDDEELLDVDLEAKEYIKPPEELLTLNSNSNGDSKEQVRKNAKIIEDTMHIFGIDCKIVAINKGPVITLYELEPAPGVKLNKIVALSDNLAMALASSDIRIEAPIPGKAVVGIEVPNKLKDSVSIRDMISSSEFKKLKSDLPLALGKNVAGDIIVSSIEKMPHLLIAGATGSGKSVCINSIITSIIYKSSPEDVKLLLIDPKVVELSIYNNIPHLLIPVVTEPKKASFALNWAVGEMERRYSLFAEFGVRDLSTFNSKAGALNEPILPKIVIIVDELADLMMVAQKEVEEYIARLAQKARAAGIYLILATQRPSVDVITGTIKANIPSRIAFSVSSQIDSRTILDMAGAERLLGKGDMLFYPGFYSKPVRIQGAFIHDDEVERVVDFVKANSSSNKKLEEKIVKEIQEKKEVISDRDELFNEAVKYIISDEQASISYLQRKLKIGYSRAARIVDQLEDSGIIGPHEGSKPRKLLLTEEEIKEMLGEEFE
ncbi:DNA segregation ATPase FtsK/SpoIIIE, S-DNA-T family [Peptoniphilus asaccharolyticus DSM 20463]|uniref:DNA segregation ATPase FtsK/SpoIIIE, S-DNA-T family n=1 Tax=Peptoniphilus asaccharolyticus DSM 20463 TaxID=573058 RepID=A0A1W1URF9_PEPAS|nr:DNA translocase FtsK [Peptoniphilus asaccharolyticus]MBL7575097.1 DNA translocase FtsK [Peptoniphilus asaccharolyticus]SMB83677.1 DNA segregation ATPase FtsK/SpoIIIE, S-DNA-T family [Peptoniphilus asaccharolyticus DSM 20463]